MRTIGVVTVGRSDYGIYRPLLQKLSERDDVDLRMFVGGMHLLERFGDTWREIEDDGFPIAERVDFLAEEDDAASVAQSIGRGVCAFAAALVNSRPDILVVLGDRYEMLAAAVAALPLTIPLAHIHGGECTGGAIDEAIRHSLTKMAHLHFASTEAYGNRVVQLGEEPWRVVVSGAPALDAIRTFQPLDDTDLAALGVRLHRPTLLVTYHPATLVPGSTASDFDALIEAVMRSGFDAVFTYPNADTSYSEIIERLDALASCYTVVQNLGSRGYFTLMSRAAAMVGNSSSGIIEAASFRLPVVDVGMREHGRMRPRNVIHVDPHADEIAAAISHVTSDDFRQSLDGLVNPYGDGYASERIADRLTSVPLDRRLTLKSFYDLPQSWAGSPS